MKLYHVSTSLKHDGYFVPRIPEFTNKKAVIPENETIPRICCGTSIEDCLTAMPCGGIDLDTLCESQYHLFKVFEFDLEKLGLEMGKDVLDWRYLYENNLVIDAFNSQEYWILSSVKATNSYIIEITDWAMDFEDIVPCEIWEEAMDGNGDYYSLYEKAYYRPISSMGIIIDVEYDIIEDINAYFEQASLYA